MSRPESLAAIEGSVENIFWGYSYFSYHIKHYCLAVAPGFSPA